RNPAPGTQNPEPNREGEHEPRSLNREQRTTQDTERMVHAIKTIDAHTAGEPLRLHVEGLPRPVGKTMLEKREWMRRHADHLRRAVMLEPRGHADMYGAMLTEPVSPGSQAGVLFMHNEGYSTMCGHGVIAATTI